VRETKEMNKPALGYRWLGAVTGRAMPYRFYFLAVSFVGYPVIKVIGVRRALLAQMPTEQCRRLQRDVA
jgi:hypothetical protein